jgi:opacity protein-like surface antigen
VVGGGGGGNTNNKKENEYNVSLKIGSNYTSITKKYEHLFSKVGINIGFGMGMNIKDNFGLELSYRQGRNAVNGVDTTIGYTTGKLSYKAYILDAYYYLNPYSENERVFVLAGIGSYKGTVKINIGPPTNNTVKLKKTETVPRVGLGLKGTYKMGSINFFLKPSLEYTFIDMDNIVDGMFEFNAVVGIEATILIVFRFIIAKTASFPYTATYSISIRKPSCNIVFKVGF